MEEWDRNLFRDIEMNDTVEDQFGRLPDPHDHVEGAFYQGVNFRRFFAWVIDVVLIGILATILIPFTAFTALIFLPFFFLFVGFAYRVFTLTGNSATWGMRLTGMEIRQEDGNRLDFGGALMHTFLYSVGVAIAPLQLISVILMLVSDKKQGLGDMIMGTAPLRTSI